MFVYGWNHLERSTCCPVGNILQLIHCPQKRHTTSQRTHCWLARCCPASWSDLKGMADPIAFIATNKLQKSMLLNTNNNTKVFVLFLCTKPFYAQVFFFLFMHKRLTYRSRPISIRLSSSF